MPHLLSFLVIAVVVVVTPGVDTALVTKNALLHRSEMLFTAVKLAGAAYLVVLGVQASGTRGGAGSPSRPPVR